jgi:hypothetical protein
MIDLVTANEFTFTPSAFIAAYIEQEDVTAVEETETRGGILDTLPKEIDNITVNVPSHISGHELRWKSASGTATISSDQLSATYGNYLNWGDNQTTQPLTSIINTTPATFTYNPEYNKTGLLGSSADGPITVSGSVIDIVGQSVSDTRTINKVITTTKGVTNTVVLVLSYGQFRAKCANAQSTVTLIYTRVSEYLNSLV